MKMRTDILEAWLHAESTRIGRRILAPFTWEEISQDVQFFKEELGNAGVSQKIAEELFLEKRQ